MKPQKLISGIKTIILATIVAGFLLSQGAHSPVLATAGIYHTINFQGKVVNKSDGTNIADNTYNFTFKFYDAGTVGNQLPIGSPWSETQSLPVTSSIFRATLGSVTTIPSTLDFNSDSLYLDITFNGETFTTRVRMTAVPYAFNAEKVNGLTVTNTTGTLTIPSGQTIAFSGANNLTFTTVGLTSLNLPTTGTLATIDQSETFTNKTIGSTGLTFSGATTDITTGTNENFAIVPNGTGLVGIGTTSPTQMLTVSGNATASGNITMGGQLQLGNYGGDPATLGNGSIVYNSATNTFRCYQNGAWTNCIGSGGSPVWSGLQAPTGNLSMNMYQSVGTSYSTTFTYGNATSTTNLFNLTDTTSNTGTGYLFNLTTAASSNLQPFHVSSAGVEAIAVDKNGNVGIGNTSPGAKLDVSAGLKVGSYASVAASLAVGTSSVPGGVGNAVFSGNIGIGNTSPGAALDVNGSILVQNGGTIDTRAAGTLGIGTATQTGLTLGRSGYATSLIGSNVTLGGIAWGGASNTLSFTTALTGVLQGNNTSAPTAITGTNNAIAKWSTSAPYLTNSNITDDGTTVTVGTGTGNITLALTNAGDILDANKTLTLGASYSTNDFNFTRNLTGTTNTQGGAVLKVLNTGGNNSGVTNNPDMILVNVTPASGTFTGNLLRLQNGSVDQFVVNASGNLTSTGTITASTANTINSVSINAGAVSTVTTLSMNNQLTNSYANAAALNLSGNTSGITFGGTGVNQIITGGTNSLALMPGGNVGIGDTNPMEKLDVAGNTTVAGNLTLDSGARTIAGRMMNNLTIGDSQTGNIVLQPRGTGATGIVQIGAGGGGSTTPDILVLDSKSDAEGSFAGVNGAMYYNASTNKFRCYENSAWKDCDTTGSGGGPTMGIQSIMGLGDKTIGM